MKIFEFLKAKNTNLNDSVKVSKKDIEEFDIIMPKTGLAIRRGYLPYYYDKDQFYRAAYGNEEMCKMHIQLLEGAEIMIKEAILAAKEDMNFWLRARRINIYLKEQNLTKESSVEKEQFECANQCNCAKLAKQCDVWGKIASDLLKENEELKSKLEQQGDFRCKNSICGELIALKREIAELKDKLVKRDKLLEIIRHNYTGETIISQLVSYCIKLIDGEAK